MRDGDRYYYENDPAFTATEIDELKNTTLSQVILRNTSIETLQEDVFIAVPRDLLAVELFPFPEVRSIELKAYPNPVQKYFNLVIENARPSNATLTIFNVNGQVISTRAVQLNKGRNEVNFELSDRIANGMYVVTLESDGGTGQLKLIKRGR